MTEIFAERPPVQAAIENGYWLRWHWFDEDGNKDDLEDTDYDDEDGIDDLYSSWPSQSALYHHNNLLNISAALNYNELRIFSSFSLFVS